MSGRQTYLGLPVAKPKVAFFELSSCEGCQLQIVNDEETLLDFLSLVEIVNFREAMSERFDDYEIAFVEGSVTRADEIDRLKKIRKQASILVSFGSCACFGGVNQLKNRFADSEWVRRQVYGDFPVETEETARPLADFVDVDLQIYGCPVNKKEVERIVVDLVVGKTVKHPKYPVCLECKQNGNICLFDLGEACLGSITRAGCDSWCTSNRFGCWGCRGPADEANVEELIRIMKRKGFKAETIVDRLETFGGFADQAAALRPKKRKAASGRKAR